MISSRKAMRPQSLPRSTARFVGLSPTATNIYLPPPLLGHQPLSRRGFSWGAKQNIGHKNPGKVWKGFSTQDHTRARKHLYRGTFWNHHCVPQLRQYLQAQEQRSSSSWGKSGSPHVKTDHSPTSQSKSEGKTEEDWYNRYQEQKVKQYNEFMRRMEGDPVGMLFGSKWAKWVDGVEAKVTKAFAPEWGWDASQHSSSQKPLKETNSSGKQSDYDTSHIEFHDQDYKIDPITNRKVFKKATPPNPSPVPKDFPKSEGVMRKEESRSQNSQQNFDVPVKRFMPPDTDTSSFNLSKHDKPSSRDMSEHPCMLKIIDGHGWLAQEGFGLKHGNEVNGQEVLSSKDGKSNAVTTKVEPALDRHFDSRASNSRAFGRPGLRYEHKENTAEDVDLLRSSDVRASAGLRGRVAKESLPQKQIRQRKLEEEAESHRAHLQKQLDQEFKQQAQRILKETLRPEDVGPESNRAPSDLIVPVSSKDNAPNPLPLGRAKDSFESPAAKTSMGSDRPNMQATISDKANKIKAQIVPLKVRLDAMKSEYDALRQRWLDEKRRQEEKVAKKLKDIHEEEVKAQKVAMEAIEVRGITNTSEGSAAVASDSAHNAPLKTPRRLQSFLPGEGDMASNVHEFANRDRWYKRKAPHASDEVNAKVQQLGNDQALVREIRDIYEETYGTIDTTHRQAMPSEQPTSSGYSDTQKPVASPSSVVQKRADLSDQRSPPSLSEPTAPLPTQAASKSELPPILHSLDNTRGSDPLAIVQRLFDALRQAQSLAQDYRNYLQQVPNLRTDTEYTVAISNSTQALSTNVKLYRERRRLHGVIQEQRNNPPKTANGENTTTIQEPCDNEVESESTNIPSERSTLSSKDAKSHNLYRMLACNPIEGRVVISKATSTAPLSNEQPLRFVDAQAFLDHPGELPSKLIQMHNEGYRIASSGEQTFILKKAATSQEVEEIEREVTMKEHLPFSTSGSQQVHEDAKARHNGHLTPHPATAQSAPEPPPNATSQDSAEPHTLFSNATLAESNLPSSEKVRREEAVFSGPSRRNWQDTEGRRATKKGKRAAKRSRTFRHIFFTGTVTAAMCYGVGVISQMMQ